MSRPLMRLLLSVAVIAALAAACSDDPVGDSATAGAPEAARLAAEIMATYTALLGEAQSLVASSPAAADLRDALRRLRDEYRVTFAGYACLVNAQEDAARAEVTRLVPANAAPGDLSWLDQAAGTYASEPAVVEVLADIRTLDDYAFVDRLAASRPGETVFCAT